MIKSKTILTNNITYIILVINFSPNFIIIHIRKTIENNSVDTLKLGD